VLIRPLTEDLAICGSQPSSSSLPDLTRIRPRSIKEGNASGPVVWLDDASIRQSIEWYVIGIFNHKEDLWSTDLRCHFLHIISHRKLVRECRKAMISIVVLQPADLLIDGSRSAEAWPVPEAAPEQNLAI
jgi:hypothetical protein